MIQIDTPFTAYRLSQEELAIARSLGTEQRAYYQTLLSDAASEKIAIEQDPQNPLRYLQQEAYLKGQIDILNMLLGETGAVTRPKQFQPEQPKESSS